MITDTQTLISATRHDHPIPVYDDGFGQLYIHRDSMGISGIVRAQTWEDAYGICQDEFFPEADETIEDLRKEYNFDRRDARIIRPLDGGPERETNDTDVFPLQVGQFVRWETIETPSEDENGWTENALFCEGYGFRPNGPNAKDVHKHGIYSKDVNGDSLEELTPKLLEELEITLELGAWE